MTFNHIKTIPFVYVYRMFNNDKYTNVYLRDYHFLITCLKKLQNKNILWKIIIITSIQSINYSNKWMNFCWYVEILHLEWTMSTWFQILRVACLVNFTSMLHFGRFPFIHRFRLYNQVITHWKFFHILSPYSFEDTQE